MISLKKYKHHRTNEEVIEVSSPLIKGQQFMRFVKANSGAARCQVFGIEPKRAGAIEKALRSAFPKVDWSKFNSISKIAK